MFTKKDKRNIVKPNDTIEVQNANTGWNASKVPSITQEDLDKIYRRIEDMENNIHWIANKMEQVLSRMGLNDE